MDNTEKSKKSLKEQAKIIIRGYSIILKKVNKPVLQAIVIASVFNAISPFMNFYFSSLILNELVGDKRKEELIQLVLLAIGLNLLVMLIKSLLNRWKNYCESNVYMLTWGIYSDKLLSMDFVDVEDPKIQQEVSSIKQHQNGMGFGFSKLFWEFENVLKSFFMVILSVAIAVSLFNTSVPKGSDYEYLDSPFIILTVVFAMGVSIFLVPYINVIGGKMWAKASDVNNFGNRLYGYYKGLAMESKNGKDIRMYKQNVTFGDKTDFLNDFSPFVYYQAKWDVVASFVTTLASGYIYLYVAMKAFAGAYDVGSIVLYVGAITQFTQGFSGLFGSIGELIKNNPFLEKIFNFLDIENKKYQGTLSVEKRHDNEYQIEFKNVSFKYPRTDEYVLKNINMKLHIGQKVAVVGMNGSGKTTMIKLLCRLYDCDEGMITLNGVDIKKYNYDEYMKIFSVVFQDFELMPFTLGENVGISTKYNDALAREYLEKAGLDSKLTKMSKGLDTYLMKNFEEDGVEVSGGEAQKIALARALYRNSPFIVLDEPTAALDPVAEFEIYSKFNEIVGDKTAIYISHRLSSCRFCDDIIVFDKGELIQRGNHDELIKEENGMYAELWNAQAQYYL